MSLQWAPAEQKRAWRASLMWAQGCICAGCGRHFDARQRRPHSPLLPTLDHVIPRAWDGPSTLDNLLLKHQKCNMERAARAPTGCDLIWQMAVRARLDAPISRA